MSEDPETEARKHEQKMLSCIHICFLVSQKTSGWMFWEPNMEPDMASAYCNNFIFYFVLDQETGLQKNIFLEELWNKMEETRESWREGAATIQFIQPVFKISISLI